MYQIVNRKIGYIVEDDIETIEEARELKKHWGRGFMIVDENGEEVK